MYQDDNEEYTLDQANGSWNVLESAIYKIYNKQASILSYEELYRNAYYLVLYRYGDMAYSSLEKTITWCFEQYFNALDDSRDDSLLKNIESTWINSKLMLKILRDIFLYMEKNYISPRRLNPILMMGYEIFKKLFFITKKQIYDRFKCAILENIKRERDGYKIDRILIKNLLHMLIELGLKVQYPTTQQQPTMYSYYNYNRLNQMNNNGGATLIQTKDIYKTYFEDDFLESTEQYYQNESETNINILTSCEYILQADKRLKQEKERINTYLDISTEYNLIKTFIKCYIIKHCKILIEMENSGLYYLFKTSKYEEINRMYYIFLQNKESRDIFNASFNDYIDNELSKIIEDEYLIVNDPVKQIQDLISIYKEVKNIQNILKIYDQHESNNHIALEKIIKQIFEKRLNSDNRINYNINYYIDHILKKNIQQNTEYEIEQIINHIFDIYAYIHDKDIFERYYKHFLANRLIYNKIIYQEYEMLIIEKMKKSCGSLYTSKIEIMWKDIIISNQITSEFQNYFTNSEQDNFDTKSQSFKGESGKKESNRSEMSNNEVTEKYQKINFDIDIKILTMGNWPYNEIKSCQVPDEILGCMKQFDKYYLHKNPGRNLTWATSLGSAEIKAVFKDKKKEFVVNIPQMCVIMLFNDKLDYTYKDIMNLTKLPGVELNKILSSFITLKLLIHSKEDGSDNFNENDMILLNENFTHKNYKIKVPIKHNKEVIPDANKVIENIAIERKYAIEACIVRIMKARKKLEHSILVSDVIRMTSSSQFTPDIPFIKNVIENLISRDYIDRAKDNKNHYVYLSQAFFKYFCSFSISYRDIYL